MTQRRNTSPPAVLAAAPLRTIRAKNAGKQHRPIRLKDRQSVVRFVKRDTARLDAERVETALGPTIVTTPEQTVLDLAHRLQLGDLFGTPPSEAEWQTQLAGQTRLTVDAPEALAAVREAWSRVVGGETADP